MENSLEYYNTQSDYLQSNVIGKYLPYKPRNTLEYLAYHDADYTEFKFIERIKHELLPFNFDPKVVTEIAQICLQYHSQIKLTALLPIVVYKIIQKYNFPITIMEFSSKINFDKSNYLKYSSQIVVKQDHQTSYKDNVFNYISFVIKKLITVTRVKPRIIKYCKKNKGKDRDMELNELFNRYALSLTKSNESAFEDNDKIFNVIKAKCKEFIYRKPMQLIKHKSIIEEKDDYFNAYFQEKIFDKHLSIAIVKVMMKKEGLSINSADLRDIFSISLSSISKGISMLKEYDKVYEVIFHKGGDRLN